MNKTQRPKNLDFVPFHCALPNLDLFVIDLNNSNLRMCDRF
ncbi:hypothetical protein [Nostoc sp. FACHB-280]|nr:hypothetical protein [Nostoc sp. FACHB-280]